MLTSIRIRNFGSCQDVHISDISPSLLFVGPNNAGKTTIMKAICWARDVAIKGGSTPVRPFFTQSSVELNFSLADEKYRYCASALTKDISAPMTAPYYEEVLSIVREDEEEHLYTRSGEELISFFDGTEQIFSVQRLAGALTFLSSISPESTPRLRSIESFLNGIRYFALDSISDDNGNWAVVSDHELQIWKAGGMPESEAGICMLKLVDLWLNDKDTFDELVTLLGPDHLNVIQNIDIEITETTQKRSRKDGTIDKRYYVYFDTEPGYAYYEDLSFGTRRILHILIAMMYEENSVMLLEQPEDGIHPGLLYRLTSTLLSYVEPMQLILTTHSPAVINEVGAQNIRIIQSISGTTRAHALSGDELTRADEYVDATGQLADYIRLLED
ncbi:AAA family ATPase [Burkholderia cenocepacia]|uniref:AAA family ATPase n=1 Tax=Burkholderia cenocepacia TaxID=95486 RepID=UPI002861F1F8|nr:AAA family ATPase [Burkholderia cenocepacia]MDR8049891.1 AAA family ATPase [Burkholderia cenocepacia]